MVKVAKGAVDEKSTGDSMGEVVGFAAFLLLGLLCIT